MKRLAKVVIPATARSQLRAWHRKLVLKSSISRFAKNPLDTEWRSDSFLRRMQYGWGNNWSAKNDYLRYCIDQTARSDISVLECGCGLSTLLLATIAQHCGNTYVACEHIYEWANRVNDELLKVGIRHPIVEHSPLIDYGQFEWYKVPKLSGPIDVVVCDGPPGETTKGGRYGLLPVMKEVLGPTCEILLDDAEREQERAIVKRWLSEFGGEAEFLGPENCIAHFRMA